MLLHYSVSFTQWLCKGWRCQRQLYLGQSQSNKICKWTISESTERYVMNIRRSMNMTGLIISRDQMFKRNAAIGQLISRGQTNQCNSNDVTMFIIYSKVMWYPNVMALTTSRDHVVRYIKPIQSAMIIFAIKHIYIFGRVFVCTDLIIVRPRLIIHQALFHQILGSRRYKKKQICLLKYKYEAHWRFQLDLNQQCRDPVKRNWTRNWKVILNINSCQSVTSFQTVD